MSIYNLFKEIYNYVFQEPTSGLDSSTACNLINTVKKLAQTQNRAVVTTIHQPSSHVFHMFDKILLLCNGKVHNISMPLCISNV